jgi:hypothetical protein
LWRFFFSWYRVLGIICPDWLQTVILLISATWVAGITGVSQRSPDALVGYYFMAGWTLILLSVLPYLARMTGAPPHPAIGWDRVLRMFCPARH